MGIEFLKKYFEDSLSLEEKGKMDQWILDPTNEKALLQFIEQSFFEEEARHPVKSFENLMQEVQKRSEISGKVVSLKRRNWLWVAAAACLIFLLIGGWVGYILKNSKPARTYGDVWLMNNTSNSNAQYAQLTLDDGSEIYLGKNSEISVSNKSSINPIVYLEGEAYFNLKHGGKTLTVKTKDLVTTAKDSKFNITSFKKDSIVTVSVEKGKAVVTENRELKPMMELRIPAKDSLQKDSTIKERKTTPWANIIPVAKIYQDEKMTYDVNSKSADVKKVNPKVIPLIDLVPAQKVKEDEVKGNENQDIKLKNF